MYRAYSRKHIADEALHFFGLFILQEYSRPSGDPDPRSGPRQIDLAARRRYKHMETGAPMYMALGGFMQLV